MTIENIQLLKSPLFSYYIHSKKYVIGTYYSKSLLLYILLLIWLMKKDHKINFSHILLHKNQVSLFHMYKYMLLWYKVYAIFELCKLLYMADWFSIHCKNFSIEKRERRFWRTQFFNWRYIVLHKMLIALIFLEIELWIME